MMMFQLEIEFLTGVYRGVQGPNDKTPDWPPQPDRIYSALVSAWAARGEQPDERAALEWLEAQTAPELHASDHTVRTAPTTYHPTNDAPVKTQRTGKRKQIDSHLEVLPAFRHRADRFLPAGRPEDPVMVVVWPDASLPAPLDALNAIASCVAYIGTSASLVRCRFTAGAPDTRPATNRTRRTVYPGRLDELERAYHDRPDRPAIPEGMPVFATRPPAEDEGPATDWLTLEIIDGQAPDLRVASLVCRLIRSAVMSGYKRADLGEAIPEVVSGHGPDGQRTGKNHLSIVPMPFAGTAYATGRVFGFGLVAPPGTRLVDIPYWADAWKQIARYDTQTGATTLAVTGRPLPGCLVLAPITPGATKRSLDPAPYLARARRWATTTPIVLDRHLKRRDDDATIRCLIASACNDAGLPQPDPDQIRAGRQAAVEGVPPARPMRGEPPWTRWRSPPAVATRLLTHAIIEFPHELTGPVLLGAGRFHGLGLCRGITTGS